MFAPRPVAGQVPPDEDWRTVRTEHFRVTFPRALESLGRRAADRAERAYAGLSRAFVSPPSGTIDLLLTDHTDISNGFTMIRPSDRITVFATPPADDVNLGFFDDWMELVITHELAHVFHLDRAGPLGRSLRKVFGRGEGAWPFFPDLGLPRWGLEGTATWYESYLTNSGRVKGTYHDMILRTAVLEGRFEDLDEASGESPLWPGGARSYAYGSLFFEYLLDHYGQERMGRFAEAVAGQWVPYRLDAAGREAFGVPISRAWESWRKELRARYTAVPAELARSAPLTRSERLTRSGRLTWRPRMSPDGASLVFVEADGRSDAQLRIAAPDGSGARELTRTNGISSFDWTPSGEVLFAQLEFSDPYRYYRDLYLVGRSGRPVRVTRGERLAHPSVAPSGAYAVAVQDGEGTNWLVKVDLADGSIVPLEDFDPDVHWAYPAVSPDGRWIAASRWTPGAMLDIVVLDERGTVVARLTRDRAVDLAPAWSPDGRYVLWSSDRSGIPNIVARAWGLDGRPAGPVLQVTQVATGAGFPSVDPSSRWLYYAGYHVDGWDVERTRFDVSTWIDASSPDARFDAPPRPDSIQDAAFSGAMRGYSPWATLRPTFWEPLYREAVRTRSIRTNDLFVRSREVIGQSVGARTSGSDLVGRHAYSAFARFSKSGGKADWGLAYAFAGLGNPTLGLSVTQFWDDDGPRLAQREEGAPIDTLFVIERTRSAFLTSTLLRTRWRSVTALTLAGGLVWDDQFLLDNQLRKSREYGLRRPRSRLGELRADLSYSTIRSFAFQLGPSEGLSAFVRGRTRSDLNVPDSLSGVRGSDRSFDEVLGIFRAYHSFHGPGYSPHVLALRVAGGAARGPDAGAGHFEVGGAAGSTEGVTGLGLFGGSPLLFPVRGFPQAWRFGNRAWAVAAEYRFPLVLLNQGMGPWPFSIDRVMGAVFFDAGNAWGPELGVGGYRNPRRGTLASVGAELIASTLSFWRLPLRLRLGVAAPLAEGTGSEVYVRAGMVF